MSWVCIREATDEDRERVRESAKRFCERHNIQVYEMAVEQWNEEGQEIEQVLIPDYEGSIDAQINYEQTYGYNYTAKLWLACLRRALRSKSATGTAYGYVGHND